MVKPAHQPTANPSIPPFSLCSTQQRPPHTAACHHPRGYIALLPLLNLSLLGNLSFMLKLSCASASAQAFKET